MVEGLRNFDFRTFWAGLSLSIPPLTLMVVTDCLCLAGGIALAVPRWISPPALIPLLGSLTFLTIVTATIWLIGGRRFVAPSTLIKIPWFLIWKIRFYTSLLWKGAPSEWKRTDR